MIYLIKLQLQKCYPQKLQRVSSKYYSEMLVCWQCYNTFRKKKMIGLLIVDGITTKFKSYIILQSLYINMCFCLFKGKRLQQMMSFPPCVWAWPPPAWWGCLPWPALAQCSLYYGVVSWTGYPGASTWQEKLLNSFENTYLRDNQLKAILHPYEACIWSLLEFCKRVFRWLLMRKAFKWHISLHFSPLVLHRCKSINCNQILICTIYYTQEVLSIWQNK